MSDWTPEATEAWATALAASWREVDLPRISEETRELWARAGKVRWVDEGTCLPKPVAERARKMLPKSMRARFAPLPPGISVSYRWLDVAGLGRRPFPPCLEHHIRYAGAILHSNRPGYRKVCRLLRRARRRFGDAR